MSAHRHGFVYAAEITKARPGATGLNAALYGSAYVCMDKACAEVRHVWETGEIEVKREGLPEEK